MNAALLRTVVLVALGRLALVADLLAAAAPDQQPGVPEPDGLRDILPPIEIPFWNQRTITWAVVLSLIVLGLLWWWALILLRRKAPPAPSPDPLRVALEALAALESAQGLAVSARDFAAAVAEIVRRFLEMRHGLAAPRQTTEEFLELAERSSQFSPVVREQLNGFLRRCDQLKFAKAAVTDDGKRGLVKVARDLVREALA